jgi:bacterioferritin-associated ferredoxin
MMAINSERTFIEAATTAARDAKELLLPVLMIDNPEEPWSVASIERLRELAPSLDPIMQEAVDFVLEFELPFIAKEEGLAAEGITLGTDMAAFEVAMFDFEQHFWSDLFVAFQADPTRYHLREVASHDVCAKHHLDSDRVRRAIRDHQAQSFEDIAPILGTSENCSHCKIGITRLLTQEIRRSKEKRETAVA